MNLLKPGTWFRRPLANRDPITGAPANRAIGVRVCETDAVKRLPEACAMSIISLRVNGRAIISTAPALLERFSVGGKAPRSVIVVSVDTVFFQCARAIKRACNVGHCTSRGNR